ncbi:MAG: heavy metal sensor histidine kinase [Verrucomicrobiales bacterium]|nr:heavy metal sensor histidine kinase [Verrucomicrobiales bacterium]
MNWLRRQSLTFRLAWWHAATALVVVVALAWFVRHTVSERLLLELDRQLRIDFDLIEAQVEESQGKLVWPLRGSHGEEGYARLAAWFEVWSEDGKLLLRHWPVPETEAHARLGPPAGQQLRFYSSEVEPGLFGRVMERPARVEQRDVILRILRDESGLRRTQRELADVFLFGLPLAVLLAVAGGWFVARRSLSPVGTMAARAREISASSLSQRLPVANVHDELGRLATVFNATLERLENSFAELRRFAADASHELRTPLTALRAEGEVALNNARDPDQFRQSIGAMLEEAQRLQDLVDSLLTLARAEADQQPLSRVPLDLGALTREVVENLRILADEKHQQLAAELNGEISIVGDPALLRHALLNLVHNAIRYTPTSGRITVRCSRRDLDALIEIADTGEGIAPEHQAKVFERFYRVDKNRSRAEGGAGLGLAIAKLAIERHGGRIELKSTPGKGSTFRVVLSSSP